MSKSQIKTSAQIEKFVENIKQPITTGSLELIRDLMYSKLTFHLYNESTKEDEKSIRWRRTADEILEDSYVYSGKACTDLTVLYIALCRALGLQTNFVKVTKDKNIHSIAEIKLKDGWYIFDISRHNKPVKGIIEKNKPFEGWHLWKKGRDAWDIDLVDFNSIDKIE